MKAGREFYSNPDRLTIPLPLQEAVVSRVRIFLPHSASTRIHEFPLCQRSAES